MRHSSLERPRYLPDGIDPDSLPVIPGNLWGDLFNRLYGAWGDPYWWPGKDAWEVAAGAILTQNTSWLNVEKALASLKRFGWTDPETVINVPQSRLVEAVRPSGYFNVKARKLKELAAWWLASVITGNDMRLSDDELRNSLLNVWGVGPETADSIASYALGRPLFVVDAYTTRTLVRLRGTLEIPTYYEIQREVHWMLPRDVMLYNMLHGLIVLLGKEHCHAGQPKCEDCPLVNICRTGNSNLEDKLI